MEKCYVNLFGVLEEAGRDLAISKRQFADLRDFLGKPISTLRRSTETEFRNEAVEVYQGRARLRFVSDSDGLIRHASLHDPGLRSATSEDMKLLVPKLLGSHGIETESLSLVLDGVPGQCVIENLAGVPDGFLARVESRSDGTHLVIEKPI